MIEVPNIDALSLDELVQLQRGLSQLERYVRARHAAVKARQAGDIAHATHCEQVCDGFYKHLPEWARW
ncbi:hypothetical protein [Burkholderia ambifaria]